MENKITTSDISKIRLLNQQIASSKFKSPKEIVSWMGAIQAQDFNMAMWAVGIRLPGSTDSAVRESFGKGEILRTHLLRPTWHLVSSEDICWLLALTAPHIKSSLKSRNKDLGLTQEIFDKSNDAIAAALSGGVQLTREEIIDVINKAHIFNEDPQSYYHLILNAELDGIICSGEIIDNKQTYALLADRALSKNALSRDEALTELAKRYFTSHGPATLQDFLWWSGLPAADGRKSLELTKREIISEKFNGQIYWFSNSMPPSSFGVAVKDSVQLLPAYDEFIISYKDRSASIPFVYQQKAISSNGIFRPVIVSDGQAVGIWKRIPRKNKTVIDAHLFQTQNNRIMNLIEKKAVAYGQFLEQKIEFASVSELGSVKS